MLPKQKRLNLKYDFKWVSTGKKIDGSLIKLFIKPGENNFPRLGISVSAKVFRKAIDRNRARRLVSTAFEDLYNRLDNNLNIIALPKIGVLKKSSDEIKSEIDKMLRLV